MSSTSSPTHPAILPPLDLRDTAELIAELGDNQRVLGRLFELVAARTLINVLYPLDGACREYMDDM